MSEGAIIIPATGGGTRGGATTKYGILTGGSRDRPWEGKGKIAKVLGLSRRAVKAAFRAGEGKSLKRQARAAVLTSRATTLLERGQTRQAARFAERATRDFPAETLPTTLRDLVGVLGGARAPTAQREAERRARRRMERRQPELMLPPFLTFPGLPAPGPIYATQPAPAPPSDVPEWIQLLALARDWWLQREEQKAAARDARRAAKEQAMSLGDFISGLGGAISSTVSAVSPAVAAIYSERAARSLGRGRMTGASGVPLGFAAGAPAFGGLGGLGALGAGAAGLLLGEEPGALEEGGLLETLGLEGDLERTATFWRRTAGGFRPVRELNARHPVTGRIGAWTYRGRPLMYTGDLAICRDVGRVARRAASRTGLRFRRGRRR